MFTTDKIGHGYLPWYMAVVTDLLAVTGSRLRVLEIGVANGEGLTMLRTLCGPDAEIWGVDNRPDASWPVGTTRIVCDQDNAALPELATGKWDLIIDDASHDNAKTHRTLEIMWPAVRAGGAYVIEDWSHAGGIARELAAWLPWAAFRDSAPATSDMIENVHNITYANGLIILRAAL